LQNKKKFYKSLSNILGEFLLAFKLKVKYV